MHRKFGNHWVEYMDPNFLIGLLDRPSNIEIGLYWYKKELITSGLTISLII